MPNILSVIPNKVRDLDRASVASQMFVTILNREAGAARPGIQESLYKGRVAYTHWMPVFTGMTVKHL